MERHEIGGVDCWCGRRRCWWSVGLFFMKVSMFIWRLLRNRFPTKNNLCRWGILHQDAQFCVAGCGQQESAKHLFLQCPLLDSLWSGVLVWICFITISPENATNHLAQFGSLSSISKSKRSLLTLIWCATAWTIWKKRNSIIFQNKASFVSMLFL